VAGFCEYDDEPSGSGATELVHRFCGVDWIQVPRHCIIYELMFFFVFCR
jgi:hypothetical protein